MLDRHWYGQTNSSLTWTCTCGHDRKIKIPPSWPAHRNSHCVCILKMQAGKG